MNQNDREQEMSNESNRRLLSLVTRLCSTLVPNESGMMKLEFLSVIMFQSIFFFVKQIILIKFVNIHWI